MSLNFRVFGENPIWGGVRPSKKIGNARGGGTIFDMLCSEKLLEILFKVQVPLW